MLLSQNFLSQSSNFVASTTQNYTSNNAFQSDSNPQSDFDMLLTLNQNPTQKDVESLIALNEITPDLSLVLGMESQTPTEDLKSLAWTHKTEFLKPISQATLSQEELNPLSYPHSISALSELMSEKLEELYATIQDPSDSKLHFLLNLKEQFVHFDSTMQTLKGDLTNKAELLACLLPHTIEQKSDLFLDRAQAVGKSAANFKAAADDALVWINAFFSEFETELNEREQNLIFKHANVIQSYWNLQIGKESGKITLDNGMVYQEYFDKETPDIRGFTLITQNFVYAYREEVLDNNTMQVVLQVYERAAGNDEGMQSSIATTCSYQMQKSLDFHGQNLKLVGETSRIEKIS